jgi:transposase
MGSMNDERARVIGGVDSHADTHAAAVLDERGVLLGASSFAATTVGYRALLGWLRSFGEVDRVGVESTGSYAAALTRYLVDEDVLVLEVNQPHRIRGGCVASPTRSMRSSLRGTR